MTLQKFEEILFSTSKDRIMTVQKFEWFLSS